ncbi:hypothetical protein RPIT_05305 [Tessaracoccus flavus]|uniref:M23ase beta-sheet core domain-containing protein n=2 Tax=Tessaracoccus flavus TaxID=1610493 RepID=A0A1Q2CDY1_9ACTN|nr:hypothetical protein RPIT_05305 [Tessaracoccus flavus]
MNRIVRGIVAAVAAVSMIGATWSPALADELDDRQLELQQELAQQAAAIEDASAELNSAISAHESARAQLASAETALAAAEVEQRAAEELDAQRAAELADAEKKLEQAKADVAAAKAALDSVNNRINEEILVTTQQNHGFLNLVLIFSDVDTSNLNQRAQLAETLFDSSAQELDELEMRRLALEDAELAATEAEKKAEEARVAAAEQLTAKQEAAAQAEALRVEVARLVELRDAAETAAAQQLLAEQEREAQLRAESEAVEARIQARIEAERKAEESRIAAAKAAAEKAAADKAAADKAAREAAARAAGNSAPKPSTTSKAPAKKPAAAAPAPQAKPVPSSILQRPVNGRLSSRYGMRLHPVLGYRKLHDGTDFAAACGTPLRAAADGVVAERYYNAGYGNRLMIDHGKIGGSYVTTGYNHATHYIVSVGQRVQRGQVIGYVGTTGYSTGCHLHLMVWENGKVVNPMAKWFA